VGRRIGHNTACGERIDAIVAVELVRICRHAQTSDRIAVNTMAYLVEDASRFAVGGK
jgi:hypothetical protein